MANANSPCNIPRIDVRLKVPNIRQFRAITSPEYLVEGIPWKIHIIKKMYRAELWLAVYLQCVKKNKPKNWSAVGCATFRLVPFDDKEEPMEYSTGYYVFDHIDDSLGKHVFIKWNELIDAQNAWVKDDTINVNVKIKAADPNAINKSAMIFNKIETCCGEDCITNYRMNLTNIESLLAVQSPEIWIRKLPWRLTAYKDKTDDLSIRLESKSEQKDISCKIKMTLKLISANEEDSIVDIEEDSIKRSDFLYTKLALWNEELLKPENGFVNDNSIAIEVELKASKPEGVNPIVQGSSLNAGAKRKKWGCAICSKPLARQEISSTKCGHVFCTTCITKSIEKREICPTCTVAVKLDDLRPIHS